MLRYSLLEMLESAEVPVGLASLESRAFRSTLRDLFALAALHEDWDSYGGRPVEPRAVSTAITVAGLVSYLAPDTEPVAVAPLASGGVHLTWANDGGNEIEVDVSPEGSLGFLLIEGPAGNHTYFEEGDVSPQRLFGVLRTFLHRS